METRNYNLRSQKRKDMASEGDSIRSSNPPRKSRRTRFTGDGHVHTTPGTGEALAQEASKQILGKLDKREKEDKPGTSNLDSQPRPLKRKKGNLQSSGLEEQLEQPKQMWKLSLDTFKSRVKELEELSTSDLYENLIALEKERDTKVLASYKKVKKVHGILELCNDMHSKWELFWNQFKRRSNEFTPEQRTYHDEHHAMLQAIEQQIAKEKASFSERQKRRAMEDKQYHETRAIEDERYKDDTNSYERKKRRNMEDKYYYEKRAMEDKHFEERLNLYQGLRSIHVPFPNELRSQHSSKVAETMIDNFYPGKSQEHGKELQDLLWDHERARVAMEKELRLGESGNTPEEGY